MRVTLVAPFVAAIDDQAPQIGGAQAVIADLARGLAGRGHAVTVIAPQGSRIVGATIVDLGIAADPRAALRPGGPGSPVAMGPIFRRISEWLASAGADVIHAHAYDAPAFAELRGRRAIHTLHLPPFDAVVVSAVRGTAARLATVSESCRSEWRAAGVPVQELLPNGIDVSRVAAGGGTGGYLAFAGRMSAEKGADVACRVARRLGLPLRLAGPRYDEEYFETAVRPMLDDRTIYEGTLERSELWRLLGRASVTVLPIRWDEPFGMVALESIACGTPVAAYRRGNLVEVVTEGRSGSLARPDNEADLVRATGTAGGLSRTACRSDASRFDVARMLDAHEALYRRMLAVA